jgi:hypothetical protein
LFLPRFVLDESTCQQGGETEIFGLLTRGRDFVHFGLLIIPSSKGEIFALGECFHRRRYLTCLELLLVVLSLLPLSGGTSFTFSFCAWM